MANDIKWEAATVALTAYLTTGLNTLANNTTKLGSTVINNETNLCTHMDLEMELASVDLSAQTNPSIPVYLIESVDGGTGFIDATDAVSAEASMPPASAICAVLSFRPGTGAEAHRAIVSAIPIPPGRWKLMPRNKTGVALAASGNVLSYRTYNINFV